MLSYSVRTLVSGGLAGCSSLCIVYPLDFIRTRLSADINHHTKREYKGLVDCTMKTVKNEGFSALYRGFAISLQVRMYLSYLRPIKNFYRHTSFIDLYISDYTTLSEIL